MNIRLSPSGPVIANPGGGPFAPGPGARLRLTQSQTTIGGTNVIPTAPAVVGNAIGAGGFSAGLTNPQLALSYAAAIELEVANPSTNVVGEAQLYLETSVDGGSIWTEQASNTHLCNSTEVAPGVSLARLVRLQLRLTTGAALGVTSNPPTALLLVRAKVGASSGGGILIAQSSITPGGDLKSVGSVNLSLEEVF